ncbi:MAG TPA: TolC family protein [Candidatus Ozemobacteraceae bacterium]|nr:TolC family protein [Candidatus Ozemobacteraceae bacterium]
MRLSSVVPLLIGIVCAFFSGSLAAEPASAPVGSTTPIEATTVSPLPEVASDASQSDAEMASRTATTLSSTVAAPDSENATNSMGNLHLEEIQRLALKQNHSVISSRQQVEIAEGQVKQARSVSSTRLTGKMTQTRLDDVGAINIGGRTIAMGKKDTQRAYVEMAQPLFLGGKDRATISAARLGRSAAQAGHFFTRQQVLRQATMSWLAWLFASEVEKVARKDLDLANEHHRLIEARLRQDQASKFELLRADVRLAQARSKYRQEQNNSDLARLELLRVLALPADLMIGTQDRLSMQEFEPNPIRDASEAVFLREDLRIKRLEAEISRQGLRAARGEKQPTLNLFGQVGSEDPSSKSGLGGLQRKSYWNAGLALEVPLADGGQRRGKIQEATARLALAENALQEALEKTHIEIKQALLNLETAQEVVRSQEEALKQAEEALRLANVKYTNGMFTQVEMFDAENAFLNTNLQYLQAVYAHHQARVAYLLATGQLGRNLLAPASAL